MDSNGLSICNKCGHYTYCHNHNITNEYQYVEVEWCEVPNCLCEHIKS